MPAESDTGLRQLFEETKAGLETQGRTIAAIDDKAAHLLRFNVLVVGLTVAGTTLFLRDVPDPRGSPVTWGLFLVGLNSLVASTVATILAFRTKEFRTGLDGEDVLKAIELEPSQAAVLRETTHTYALAILSNIKSLDRAVLRTEWPSGPSCWGSSRSRQQR